MSENRPSVLISRIEEDLKQAMREHDEVGKLALRAAKTALVEARTATQNHALDDQEAIGVLQKLAKRRRDTASEYEKLGLPDRAQAELAELAVFERYLPSQLSPDAVEEIVRRVITQKGATTVREMGAVMSAVMQQVAGQTDGKLVSQIVRRLLSN